MAVSTGMIAGSTTKRWIISFVLAALTALSSEGFTLELSKMLGTRKRLGPP